MLCLLTALGSYGDVHPMVGLGVAMRARGHEVKIITNPHFAEVVRQAGLKFVGLGGYDDYEELTQHESLWNPRRGLEVVLRFGAMGCLEELYGILERLYQPGETVVGAHGLDVASRLFAETHSAPVASICFAPFVLWSNVSPPQLPIGPRGEWVPRWFKQFCFQVGNWMVIRPQVVRPLNRFRQKNGLPPMRKPYWEWYYRTAPPICLFPDWFAQPQADWPSCTKTTSFPLWDGGVHTDLTAGARDFLEAEDPPIVFTPGSANREAQDFMAAASHACQILGKRGVLLTKYEEQVPGNLPSSVRWLGFQPLGQVLAHSAAFVHHGGIGSCAQGLAAGVPQVIQPMAFDQFDNVQRLKQLGVAAELDRKRFRGPALAATLDELLRSEPTKLATQKCAELIQLQLGLSPACDALESRLAQ